MALHVGLLLKNRILSFLRAYLIDSVMLLLTIERQNLPMADVLKTFIDNDNDDDDGVNRVQIMEAQEHMHAT